MKLTVKPLCVMTAMLALATGAGAQTYTVLKSFNSNVNMTGFHAWGTPVQGPDGTLYGVTTDGGAGASGVVFRIQTNGTAFTVIKSFSLVEVARGTNTDGATPHAGLVLSGSTLYGTTMNGGSGGSGTVFSLSTNGNNFTVLKNFPALAAGTNSDGANPVAALVLSNGVLYGTAQNGGVMGFGTIFRLNTNGTGFTNLYNFSNGSDGGAPSARLLLSGSTLYGTAQYGGDDGVGTVFSISTNGTSFNRLHSFSGSGTDGAGPVAGLVLTGGQLFGTTPNGDNDGISDDGTVFRIDISGNNFTNLFSFTDANGFDSIAELVLSGSTLYGTTANGGFNFGTVFKINTDGSSFGTVVSLNAADGWGPSGGVVLSSGALYGLTGLGGMPGLGNGVVYSVNINGSSPTALVLFAGPSGAAVPNTGLALSSNTLFGTTVSSGMNSSGSLFEINTNGSGYAEIRDLSIMDNNGDNPDGAQPRGVLVLSGGMFYGTTRYGGTNGWGTVFKMNADGTGFTNIYSFNNAYPESPISALAVSGSTIYGAGGAGSYGSLFKLNTDGSGFTNFYSFNGSDGNGPGALTVSGNTLYGATGSGGAGYGNLYQVNTDGSHYTNIYSLSGGSEGANPGNVLVLSNNVLYGTAYHGGSGGQGTVFKVNTDQTGFTVLHTFAGPSPNGAGPGDLLLSGGMLYGIMAYDGTSNSGAIFQLDITTTNFIVLKNFTGGDDGATPTETLVLAGNTLYGTTEAGGLAGQGTVFSLGLSSVVPLPLTIKGIGNAVVLSWTDPSSLFSLQAAPLVTGTYTNVPGATSPYTNAISGATEFFRLLAN